VVAAPALGRRWWATRGDGAFAGDEANRIRVSAVDRLGDSVVSTSEWHEMPPGWARLASEAWVSRGFGDFWQHCLVAEGAVDVAAEPSLAIWDYSAVQLIVEEAGGRCSTFTDGAPALHPSATNGALHDAAVTFLGGQTPKDGDHEGDRPHEVASEAQRRQTSVHIPRTPTSAVNMGQMASRQPRNEIANEPRRPTLWRRQ
jgi:histidinol-phosphatase